MKNQEETQLTVGDLASRTGLAASAIRFYETKGLVTPTRSEGGQRRFQRSDIRRLSFILIAQRLGFTLTIIGEQLGALPEGRTPTKRDSPEAFTTRSKSGFAASQAFATVSLPVLVAAACR